MRNTPTVRYRHHVSRHEAPRNVLVRFVSLAPVVLTMTTMVIHTPVSVAALAGAVSGKNRSSGGGGFSKSPPLTYQPDTSPATRRLVQVLTEKDAVLDGTEIGWCSTKTSSNVPQRGLFATRNFKTDQVICKIPSAWVLALSDPNNNNNQNDDTTTNASNMAQLGANFLTMYYQNPTVAAQWSFYFDSLPRQTRNDDDAAMDTSDETVPFLERTPDWYSSEELALLEFPRSINLARQRQADIDNILLVHQQNDSIRRDALQWATTLVSTRSFGLAMAPSSASAPASDDSQAAPQLLDDRGQVITPTGERTVLRVLIPYLDMVNHVSLPKANAQWTVLDPDRDDAWLALTASRPISAGQEITRSYEAASALSNVELLTDYGIVEAGNPMDAYMLRKGGVDTLQQKSDWSTTLDEDETMLQTLVNEQQQGARRTVATDTLQTILKFRLQLKKSYPP